MNGIELPKKAPGLEEGIEYIGGSKYRQDKNNKRDAAAAEA
jgi:hypothetical protein